VKLVTQDYGCGTSSSILDYGVSDVVVVSESSYDHVFDVEDDLFFIGHDFLFFLWDSEEKIKRWHARKGKWEHWVWCFERVDAIVPAWQQKSHYSLSLAGTFCNRVLACDEDDCDKYGFDWLPQWASRKFYDKRSTLPTKAGVLFSGQAGKPEYAARTQLLNEISRDPDISGDLRISNVSRSLCWDSYVDNLLDYTRILNPVGVFKGLNTRAYEAIYSGRLLFQHTVGKYKRHEKLLEGAKNVIFFENSSQLKDSIVKTRDCALCEGSFESQSLFARMRSIGVEIK
jgi:hypothetical protein